MNLIFSGIISLILSSPIIYRILKIRESGITPPYSEGIVSTIPVIDLVNKAEWASRESFSVVTLLLLVLVGINLNKKAALIPYFVLESTLILFGSNIMPWAILQKFPIFENFQNTGWRFIIYTSAIPFVLFLINYSEKASNKLLKYIFIITILGSTSTVFTFQQDMRSKLRILNSEVTQNVSEDEWVLLESSGITSDRLQRNIIQDYIPEKSVNFQKIALENNIQVNGKFKETKAKYELKNVRLSTEKPVNGKVKLPIYGYKSLNYRIFVNGKNSLYTISQDGLLQVEGNNIKKIDIEYQMPKVYMWLLGISIISLLILFLFKIFEMV